VINWRDMINCVGEESVIDFCNHSLTAREFESLDTECRRAVRLHGADKCRQLAKRALNRMENYLVSTL